MNVFADFIEDGDAYRHVFLFFALCGGIHELG